MDWSKKKKKQIRKLFTYTLVHVIIIFCKAPSVWPVTSGTDVSGPNAEMHHTWGRQEAAAECHRRVSAVVCEAGSAVYLRPLLIKPNSWNKPRVWRWVNPQSNFSGQKWAAFESVTWKRLADNRADLPTWYRGGADVVPCVRREEYQTPGTGLFHSRFISSSNHRSFGGPCLLPRTQQNGPTTCNKSWILTFSGFQLFTLHRSSRWAFFIFCNKRSLNRTRCSQTARHHF